MQVLADGSDPNTATIVVNYLSAILAGYARDLAPASAASYEIVPQVRYLYNEEQNGSLSFVPGVIALWWMTGAPGWPKPAAPPMPAEA